MNSELRVTAPDGRQLDVEVFGPPDGEAVFFHNGTPASGTPFAPNVELGSARGLRHIAYSRPGYASSDRLAGRTVADCAQDVAEIADRLGVERFYTVGFSGGGPHALACAALLPSRVIAAATVGGAAPSDAEGLDFLDGMGKDNLEEFGAALEGEVALRQYMETLAPELLSLTAADVAKGFGDLLAPVDRAVLTGEFAQYLVDCQRAAFAHGIWGWLDDDLAFVSSWGFELPAITVPVTIWHGHHDRFVPLAHGEWLASHVPGARAVLAPEHGHLSLAVGAYGDVLDDLIGRAT